MLRIKTFGGLFVQDGDRSVAGAAAQPRRLAILALLAQAGERGVTRDKVAAYLWPDAEEERARRALTQALYALRRDLGSEEAIVGIKDLRLNPELVSSDVLEFEEAMARGGSERAATLHAGPFLDGFHLPAAPEFERWVEDRRRGLAHDYAAALERLASDAAARGEHRAAVGWWRKLAAHDPLNANAAISLMQALVADGDRGGAIRHARVYEVLVAQDLDLPPDREVAALARRLREEPPEQPPERASPERPPPERRPPERPAPDPPPFDLRSATAPGAQQLAAISFRAAALEATAIGEVGAAPGTIAAPAPRAAGAAPPRRRRRWPAWLAVVPVAVGLGGVAAALLAVRLRPGAAREGAPPVVALGRISDYRDGAASGLARPLTDMLATSLGRLSGARVVSTARMYELLSQAGGGGDTSPAALVTAARQAGATELVDGALYAVGEGRLRLDLRRVDLASGRMRATHSVTGESLFQLADSATARLAAALGGSSPGGSISEVTTRSLSAYHLYEQGLRAYYQRDFRTATSLFEAALTEDSTFAMAAYYSGLAAQPTDPTRAMQQLARAARFAAHATDRERLTIRAHLAYFTDESSLRAMAETLVVRYPAEVEGYFFSGISLVNAGEFLAAVSPLNRAIAMDSLALGGERARCVACDALRALAVAYQGADSLAAAEREARRWLRLQPRSAAAWRTLAEFLEQRGRSDEAMAALRAEASIAPPSAVDELSDRATHLIYAGDYDQAEQFLLRQMEGVSRPQESEVHWFLAISYRQQGRLTEALARARRFRTIEAPPARMSAAPPQALMEAQVLFELGRWRASAALFDSIARWSGGDTLTGHLARRHAWAGTHAANALAAAGDTAGLWARADSIRVIGGRSNFGRDHRLHHHVRGLLFAARGRDAEAVDEFRRAVHSPNLGYTRSNYEIARLSLRSGRARDALAALQPALRGSVESSNLYVTRTELHELLALAWDATGDPGAGDSAAAHWAQVVRAWRRADPAFGPRLELARARLAALRR